MSDDETMDDCADGCDEALRGLHEYLDGELTADRRAELLVHLEDCAPCLDAFDFEKELRAVIANGCRRRVPDDLRRRIVDQLGLPDAPAGG